MKLLRISVILAVGWFLCLTKETAGQSFGRLTPRVCQGKETNWMPLETIASKCYGMAPPGTVDTCIKLCMLHDIGVLVNRLVTDVGIEGYVRNVYAPHLWDRIRDAIHQCTNRYVEDAQDPVCLRSARYIDCFDDAATKICGEPKPLVIPPPQAPPPPLVRIPRPPPPSQCQNALVNVLGICIG